MWEERKKERDGKKNEVEGETGVKEKSKDEQQTFKRLQEEDSSSEDEGWCEGVRMFRGIGSVEDEVEEEWTERDDKKTCDKTESNGLKAVMKEYMEDDEDVMEAEEDVEEEIENEEVEAEKNEDVPHHETVLDVEDEEDINIGTVEESRELPDGDSSDEAPEEIKIVKGLGNDEPEDPPVLTSATSEETSKKARKRKRKHDKKGDEVIDAFEGDSKSSTEKVPEPVAKVTFFFLNS